jgi:hypothetical protein
MYKQEWVLGLPDGLARMDVARPSEYGPAQNCLSKGAKVGLGLTLSQFALATVQWQEGTPHPPPAAPVIGNDSYSAIHVVPVHGRSTNRLSLILKPLTTQ